MQYRPAVATRLAARLWPAPLLLVLAALVTGQIAPRRAVAAGPFACITDASSDTVSVIDTSANAAVVTVPVGVSPFGVAANPAGTRIYVANEASGAVSVIDAATNTVVATAPPAPR